MLSIFIYRIRFPKFTSGYNFAVKPTTNHPRSSCSNSHLRKLRSEIFNGENEFFSSSTATKNYLLFINIPKKIIFPIFAMMQNLFCFFFIHIYIWKIFFIGFRYFFIFKFSSIYLASTKIKKKVKRIFSNKVKRRRNENMTTRDACYNFFQS